ncbi:SRPBCC domain-containing protein [Amycolatopsis dendrobii]|uniref:SRPBCC domain-containing protein n=1 Tax=Amycolatopsis dendrobii TaxID=2760662 RepID=A0A7W3ZD17_9PSEU|nr:SRPBCC domain-containing protein [Amycolatopsis dendrobii]MBB1156945.1 SRPBCC domain-containing protein [Amycolatopsis dendrobii]
MGDAVISKRGETTIVVTREVGAPRAAVWAAHHEPEQVSRWWGVEGHDNHITEIDLRPGGRWRFGQRGPDGTEVVFGGEYREIEPPRKFSYTKGWPGGDSLITILFDESGAGTAVTLLCEFASRELRDRVAEEGMGRLKASYDRMDALLAAN